MIKRKFHKNTFFIEIFFCLFCNFRGSKSTRTPTQNREKQRNSLTNTATTKKRCRKNRIAPMKLCKLAKLTVIKNVNLISNLIFMNKI
jgi:hypothetical protein